MDYKK